MKPTPGRIVLFRDPSGMDFPAVITVTADSWKPNVGVGGVQPQSDGTVHLTVFTMEGPLAFFHVPEDATKDAHVPSFTWRWPPRD